MVKVLYIMHRRSDLSMDAFLDYWRNTHGPMTARMPGLRRYVQSRPYPDPHGDPLPADGVDELQFDSVVEMQDALASAEGQAMLAGVGNFLDRERSGPIVIEEDVVLV